MTIFYQNVRGLKSKINSLQCIIEESKPTIIVLVETHLDEEEEIELEGYKVERNDRNGDGGGVLIAYKDVIKNIVSNIVKVKEGYEGLWVDINNKVGKIKLGTVYFPQENETKARIEEAFDKLKENVEEWRSRDERCVIIGDFNGSSPKKK